MNILYLISGFLIYVLMASDLIKTIFSAKGGGFLSKGISRAVWDTIFIMSGKNGKSVLLEYAGMTILMTLLFAWILGLWLGLFLLLLGDGGSVINSTTQVPATVLEKAYYAGFSLSTLGVGDFVASSSAWRLVSSAAAFSGLVFITSSITYFVPVLPAVSLQSKLSLYISSMGKIPQEMIIKAWNGKDFASFFKCVPDICQMLMQHTLNHYSYPIIHYFHKKERHLAIIPNICALKEGCYLLRQVVSSEIPKDELKMSMLQTALDTYLDFMKAN